MTSTAQLGRPLTDRERDVLSWILEGVDVAGARELRAQASEVTVMGGPLTMLTLATAARSVRSSIPDGPLPTRVTVVGDGDDLLGEILVWVDDGQLSALEYAWYTDEPPTVYPAVSQLRRR